jgi:hypothetical protein
MIALGGRIVIPKEEDGFYENIFNTAFPNGSTIYADLNTAESKLGDVAYFIAIGLERLKEQLSKKTEVVAETPKTVKKK